MNWLGASLSFRQQVTRNQVVTSQFLPLSDSFQPPGQPTLPSLKRNETLLLSTVNGYYINPLSFLR